MALDAAFSMVMTYVRVPQDSWCMSSKSTADAELEGSGKDGDLWLWLVIWLDAVAFPPILRGPHASSQTHGLNAADKTSMLLSKVLDG